MPKRISNGAKLKAMQEQRNSYIAMAERFAHANSMNEALARDLGSKLRHLDAMVSEAVEIAGRMSVMWPVSEIVKVGGEPRSPVQTYARTPPPSVIDMQDSLVPTHVKVLNLHAILPTIRVMVFAIYKGFGFIAIATGIDPMATAWTILGTLAIVVPSYALRELYKTFKGVKG